MPRSLLVRSGRGGRSQATFRESDHPVCAAAEASQHFLTGAATPPLEEGTTARSNSNVTVSPPKPVHVDPRTWGAYLLDFGPAGYPKNSQGIATEGLFRPR